MNNDEQREKIARHIAEYLASGKKITVLPGPIDHSPKSKADTRSTLDGRG